MPRKPRVWFPGAMYHITCRGNRQSDIFREDMDRYYYLKTLRETKQKYPYILHGYCLMTNHVHLHLETIDVNIGEVMKKINMTYAVYFNNKYSFVGHLFQDRFRSDLIDSDPYNLQVSRYIHLNPVSAGIVDNALDYQWSSYREYMGIRKDDLVTTDFILNYFNSLHLYKDFVEQNSTEGQTLGRI